VKRTVRTGGGGGGRQSTEGGQGDPCVTAEERGVGKPVDGEAGGDRIRTGGGASGGLSRGRVGRAGARG